VILGRRVLAVAAVVAMAAPAAATAQTSGPPTELWRQFPLDPAPTPTARERTARLTQAAVSGGGGGSGTAWLIAGALGVAGIGLTIAGLASARREPQEEPEPAARRRAGRRTTRDRQADAEKRARRRAGQDASTTPADDGGRAPRRAGKDSTPSPTSAEGGVRTAHRPAEDAAGRTAAPTGRARSRPLRAPEPVPAAPGVRDDADWEECHIVLAADEGDEHHFFAEHAGAADPVARSPVFHVRRAAAVMESAPARDALQALVTMLLASGWQVVGRDDDAWALKFRRRVQVGDRERHPAGR
jgi:hypothetical protein